MYLSINGGLRYLLCTHPSNLNKRSAIEINSVQYINIILNIYK